MLTGDIAPETKRQALLAGAKDFVEKPFDNTELICRIKNLLETRLLQLELIVENETLEERVSTRTIELEEARREALEHLAVAAEFRDDMTGEHAKRVGLLASLIAKEMGQSEDVVGLLSRAAPLHDIGKIGIRDSILLKAAPLTKEEFEVMKRHTQIGGQILADSKVKVLQMAREIALTHHERWDGRGYEGLKGREIPISGRITALADAFDAMTHDRHYRKAIPTEEALEEITEESGRQFDPDVVTALCEGDVIIRLSQNESVDGKREIAI
jgi:putative two-component system response regulator